MPTADTARVDGDWYLNVAGKRRALAVTEEGGLTSISVLPEGRSSALATDVEWDEGAGVLAFRVAGEDGLDWYRASIVEGVIAGRIAPGRSSDPNASAPSPTDYSVHLTGWRAQDMDAALAPRVYDLLLDGGRLARVRLDRDLSSPSGFVARVKVYATKESGAWSEEAEHDVDVTAWDGNHLALTEREPGGGTGFVLTVSGRLVTGTATISGGDTRSLRGERAEVLSHGFAPMTPESRAEWQARARRQLTHLTMDDNPAPLATVVTELSHPAPQASIYPPLRDDDPDHHPQNYTLTELQFDYTLPPSFVPGLSASQAPLAPPTRRGHAYLAVPTGPVPAGGFPAVLSTNGHDGSAHAQMNPADADSWYGDGFARRGFVVLAIDVSHRPLADRGGLYSDYDLADDAAGGNTLHPSIRSEGFDSNWSETGERTWDALRGIEHLRSLPSVDKARILVNGMSMGGEVATTAAALSPNVAMAISSNYAPDLSVLEYKNAHPCWHWVHGDIREYLEPSDLHAMIAPRPLLVQTGRVDYTFSLFTPPFAGDKQVLRRSRAAYADAPDHLLHYLHDEEHHYHAGDVNPATGTKTGVTLFSVTDNDDPTSIAWQSDGTVIPTGKTVFEWIEALSR